MDQSTLDALMKPLTSSSAPGLQTVDPRFTEITDLSARQDFSAVADRVASLVADGIYDIRVIVLAQYQRFLSEGIAGLSPVVACLLALLGPNLAALGPASRREQHVDKSVAWLCKTVSDRIEYHASKQDEVFAGYQALDEPALVQLLLQLQSLCEALSRGGMPAAHDSAAHVIRWVKELQRMARTRTVQAADRPEAAALAAGLTARDAWVEAEGARGLPSCLDRVGEGSITLRGSHPLRELIFKLSAFELLIRAGRFDRAAVLCDEVQAEVDNFDPRVYLPELFAAFGRLHAEHIVQLEAQREHRDSTRWRAYQQFYRVDPRGFVEVD